MPCPDSLDAARSLLRSLADDPGQNEAARIRQLVARLRQLLPDPADGPMVDAFAAGTEVALHTAPTAASSSTHGRADTLHGDLIVEFKRDLPAGLAVATLELRRYTAACWSSQGLHAARLCVGTDVLRWRLWRPVPLRPHGPWSEADVHLDPLLELDLSAADDDAAEQLITLLRRVVVQEPRLPLSAENVRRMFGAASGLFARGTSAIEALLAGDHPSLTLARELWTDRARYGLETADSYASYAAHAWLILLSRTIVAASVASGELGRDQLRAVLDGSFFDARLPGVEQLVEHDLFGWTTQPAFAPQLLPVLADLAGAVSRFELGATPAEDVLGLLFAELMPEEARIMLGQARTPRALAEQLAHAVLVPLAVDAPVLETAAGSGSILVALLRQRRAALEAAGLAPDAVLRTIADTVVAMDVDPVAVALAKANWVLLLRDLLVDAAAPVRVPVFQADALFVAARQGDATQILSFDDDRVRVPVPAALLADRGAFDAFVDWARGRAAVLAQQDTADASGIHPAWPRILGSSFTGAMAAQLPALTTAAQALVGALAAAMLANRDGVWAFVLRNRYGPTMLAGRFAAIVANPPWLTVSRLPVAPYRLELERLMDHHGVHPQAESAHHLEVATPFLIHAVEHFLQPGGRFAFVMPWSVADAGHHEPFRRALHEGRLSPRLEQLWDLRPVPGLFEVLSCVLVGQRGGSPEPRYLGWHQLDAPPDRSEPLELSTRGKRSRWGPPPDRKFAAATHHAYPRRFEQGADLMPRTAVFVAPRLELPGLEVPVATDPREVANRNAKVLKGRCFEGRVGRRYLWHTVTSNALLPFVIASGALPVVAMPFAQLTGRPAPVLDDELLDLGERATQRFFAAVDAAIRAEQPRGKPLRERLDFRGKLRKQRWADAPLLVHMGAGGAKPCAAIQRGVADHPLPFVADQTTYVMRPRDEAEAHYAVGVINSQAMILRIRDFQARGMFGARHVHKLPLYELPPWDPSDPRHQAVSQLSAACEQAAIAAMDARLADTTSSLAARRGRLQKAIAPQLAALDAAVQELLA